MLAVEHIPRIRNKAFVFRILIHWKRYLMETVFAETAKANLFSCQGLCAYLEHHLRAIHNHQLGALGKCEIHGRERDPREGTETTDPTPYSPNGG